MKYLRSGFTDSTLLFFWYIENILKENISGGEQMQKLLINFLYSTCGFYDKTIIGSYFDFDDKYNEIKESDIYNRFMRKLMKIINNCEFNLNLHKIPNNLLDFKDNFINYLNIRPLSITREFVYDKINGKNLLIISSFAELIEYQINSGNCAKIYNDFPKILSVVTYTMPYIFFNGRDNNGIDNNIFETYKRIKTDIKSIKQNYDIAIVASGSYSNLLANVIDKLNKDVIVLGGNLQDYFGIASKRCKPDNTEFWITEIPDKYKPKDYMKIEDGCYW